MSTGIRFLVLLRYMIVQSLTLLVISEDVLVHFPPNKFDRTGIEPSPIDCFKKFHISKGKNGEGENWPSEKAKELYEKMENKKAVVEQENLDVNDWDIYREVIAPSHGRVLGLGGGVKAKDAYYSSTVISVDAWNWKKIMSI